MPIQKIVTLYQYDELPTEKAKEKARDWFREVDTFGDFLDYEDFLSVCERLGIEVDSNHDGKGHKIYWSGFWSQGDGASFAGTLRAKPDAGEAIREYAPLDEKLHRIGDAIAALSIRFPDLYAKAEQGRYGSHYVHSNTMSVDVEVGENEDGEPLDAGAPIDDEVTRLMRDLADWLYRQLKTDYEYRNSDEEVADSIRCNEYTFTETGKRED